MDFACRALTIVLALMNAPAMLCGESTVEAPEWSYTEAVEYVSRHDPSELVLADGRTLTWAWSMPGAATLDSWQGKSVLLAFNGDFGPVLIDPKTQLLVPIVHGLDPHPIDILQTGCLEKAETTLAMGMCHGEARERWDRELNRVYLALVEDLREEHHATLQAAQRAWMEFRDCEIEAISAVYGEDGSLWKVLAAEQVVDLTRRQTLRLSAWLGR